MSKRFRKPQKNKKRIVILVMVGVLLLLILLLLWLRRSAFFGDRPVLTVETPQKIDLSETEEFTLDVTVSTFGEADYPAASMSITFDPSRLEFLGVEEGNVFVYSSEDGVSQKLPEWSCSAEQSNRAGKINIMYLDTTGGRNAFSKALLAQENNVVLRLRFRLRGSVRAGDVCDLIFEDAVFAASNEAESLAMTRNTLSVRNGKIVIGE